MKNLFDKTSRIFGVLVVTAALMLSPVGCAGVPGPQGFQNSVTETGYDLAALPNNIVGGVLASSAKVVGAQSLVSRPLGLLPGCGEASFSDIFGSVSKAVGVSFTPATPVGGIASLGADYLACFSNDEKVAGEADEVSYFAPNYPHSLAPEVAASVGSRSPCDREYEVG